MSRFNYSDTIIKDVLRTVKTIALLGASANNERPSHHVMQFLLDKGYEVIPVNPGLAGKELLGQTVVAQLSDIDKPIDMVEIFRNKEALPSILDEVLQLKNKPSVFWGQLGVYDEDVAAKAEEAGMTVIMDRCPAIEIPRLMA